MPALAFDTHKAVKTLKAAGANEILAEAVVSTVGDAIGGNVATKADLVELQATTKADLAELQATTKADLAELQATTKAEIANLRADMLKVAIGIVIANAGLTVALLKLL